MGNILGRSGHWSSRWVWTDVLILSFRNLVNLCRKLLNVNILVYYCHLWKENERKKKTRRMQVEEIMHFDLGYVLCTFFPVINNGTNSPPAFFFLVSFCKYDAELNCAKLNHLLIQCCDTFNCSRKFSKLDSPLLVILRDLSGMLGAETYLVVFAFL